MKKRISHRKKNGKRGGAISDYIPSADTVASYIPYGTNALRNYRDAKNLYTTGKKAFEIYQEVIHPKPLPPLPPGGLPTDRKSLAQSRRDAAFNRRMDENLPNPMYDSKRMLEMLNADRIKYPPGRLETKSDLITKLREIKPISFIDNTLNSLGQRDRVRNYLSQSELGKNLVTGTDLAIQHGFGSSSYARKHLAKSKRGAGRKTWVLVIST